MRDVVYSGGIPISQISVSFQQNISLIISSIKEVEYEFIETMFKNIHWD